MRKRQLAVVIIGYLLAASNRHPANATNESKDSIMSETNGFKIIETTEKPEELMAQIREIQRQAEACPTKKKLHSGWEPVTIELHSTSRGKPVRVAAKKSEYYAASSPSFALMPSLEHVTAFVTDRGNIWLGPALAFYIETEKGVVGAFRKRDDLIMWCESIFKRKPNEKPDLEAVIRRFENEVDGRTLRIAAGHYDMHPLTGLSPADQDASAKRVTDFIYGLGEFFLSGNSMPIATSSFPSVQVEGKTVRLGLKGRRRLGSGGNGSATVWIDIESKKVLKTEWDGKQVWPK